MGHGTDRETLPSDTETCPQCGGKPGERRHRHWFKEDGMWGSWASHPANRDAHTDAPRYDCDHPFHSQPTPSAEVQEALLDALRAAVVMADCADGILDEVTYRTHEDEAILDAIQAFRQFYAKAMRAVGPTESRTLSTAAHELEQVRRERRALAEQVMVLCTTEMSRPVEPFSIANYVTTHRSGEVVYVNAEDVLAARTLGEES